MHTQRYKYGFKHMSVKLIDSTKTVTTVKDGVTWYSNPVLHISVTSDGRVYNNRTQRFLKKTAQGLYSVYYTTGTEFSNPTSLESLLSHMLGIPKTRGEKFELLDKSKGFVKDNIIVVQNTAAWKRRGKAAKKSVGTDVKHVPVDVHVLETSIIEIEGFQLRVIETEHEFVTEDDQRFKSKKEAEEHQANVDKGKECAQLIVEDNKGGGYTLAEKIFLLHVPGKKQYKNFAEMLNNDTGIVEIGANPTYKFVPLPSMGEFKDLIIETEFSKEKAEEVAKLLKQYTESTNALLNALC